MFKSFRKPKWKAIPAIDIHAGDVVSKVLIVGPVLFVAKENIQGHDYVRLIVDIAEPGNKPREATINVLPNTLIKVIAK